MRDDLNTYTISELKEWLDGLGYYLPSKINKNSLVDKGNEHREWLKSFKFFDRIPQEWFVHFAGCIQISQVLLLSYTCKRLRKFLTYNLTWEMHSKRLIAYDTIHPEDLKRKQPEGFWLKWYINNSPHFTTTEPPFLGQITHRNNVYDVWIPVVGSLFNDGQKAFVCIKIVLYKKGKNQNLPKHITISPCREPLQICLNERKCSYIPSNSIGSSFRFDGVSFKELELVYPNAYPNI